MDTRIKKGLIFFYIVSLLVSGIIIYYTANIETWKRLVDLKLRYILLTLILTIVMWIFDYMRIRELAKGIGEEVSLPLGLKIVWTNLFLAAVTPFQTGGGPMQVFLMYKNKIPISRGIVITSMKFIIALLFFAVVSPTIILLYPDLLPQGNFKYVFSYIIFFFTLTGVLYIFTILFPKRIKSLLYIIVNFLNRFKFIKVEYTDKLLKFGLKNINEFNTSFKVYLTKGRKNLYLSILYTFMFLLIQFSIPIWLIRAFGFEISAFNIILNQIILTTLMYFTPTPGGSGIAEGGFMLLFLKYVPKHSIGLVILLWRFFVIYLGVILGLYIFIKVLGEVTLDKIMNVESERS
ncbi:lysylphosphatidylglycerol synthase transmembrane domain-containing protein [Selenihalanaerobacter shriftii]|uniref:Phosphatidylglycerol lysyltransferase n=1 Tax=Selenihalanaerobacter shriftii TaxID=142842 RepID=A0A1T4LWP6_9FIRM|nr:flippase-like domain-containing protein [Selenihalanaerobacter shriftii]SJZ59112.1 hypothetical protein SAMN02745118_01279 [Selenihalanaerobacter shriftii]